MPSRITIAIVIGRINVNPAAPSGSSTVSAASGPYAAELSASSPKVGTPAAGPMRSAFDIAPPSNRGQPRGTGGSNVINSVTLRIYTVVARCRYGGSEGFGRRQIAETQIRLLHLLAPS